MVKITTKKGTKKEYKNYNIGIGAYLQKGYVKLIHKKSGNIRKFKI